MKLIDYFALLWVGCLGLVILLSPFTLLALVLHYLFS